MRPTWIAAARPIAVPPPERTSVSRGSQMLEFAHFRRLTCVVRSEMRLCAVKQPRFSSNLSTFMSNCISVVTTLERNVSGRCRTTILPQARALPRADTSSARGFFHRSLCIPALTGGPAANTNVAFQIQPDSSKGGLLTRSRVYSPNVEP
jgi:hypothetical protein